MTKIILVTGKAQSGKDTTVDFLTKQLSRLCTRELGEMERWGVTTKKYAFAQYLKEIAVELFDIPDNQVNGSNEEKDLPTIHRWENMINVLGYCNHSNFRNTYQIPQDQEFMTGRQWLQFFGSEIVRKLYPDAWVSRAYKDIKRDGLDYAFVADARFPNEISYFLDKGESPMVIHLTRNILNKKHISETALDNFDWSVVKNYYRIDNQDWEWAQKDEYLTKHIIPKVVEQN